MHGCVTGRQWRGACCRWVGGSTNSLELAPARAPSPPAPLPRKAGERGEFDPVSDGFVRGARPLRARITRPPPPKLLGEVGAADGRGGSTIAIVLVPLPRPRHCGSDFGDRRVADAQVLGMPYVAGPPSPRRRTLRFPSGEFIRSRGRTARYRIRIATGIIRSRGRMAHRIASLREASFSSSNRKLARRLPLRRVGADVAPDRIHPEPTA
jgi:hypothetical protein